MSAAFSCCDYCLCVAIVWVSHLYLQLMSADNQEFMVVGVLGPPGAGKSTILNEIYGFDSSSQG